MLMGLDTYRARPSAHDRPLTRRGLGRSVRIDRRAPSGYSYIEAASGEQIRAKFVAGPGYDFAGVMIKANI
jgi:hypothetical protein